jgi:hypothetical protein
MTLNFTVHCYWLASTQTIRRTEMSAFGCGFNRSMRHNHSIQKYLKPT